MIKKLSKELISKIAAGEVVEGPYSVVKEIIENAIDAKASDIFVEIEKAGIKKIKIVDNGNGMDKEDLLKCFLPHTTSKIFKSEDLHNINTLGFRGEALNSICAISKVKIISKTEKEILGNEINIAEGKIVSEKQVGTTTGTKIKITDLFYNTPARKKFLKGEQTEFTKIFDVVSKYALAHPEISFTLNHNRKTIFKLPKQKLHERIEELLGKDILNYLLEVTTNNTHVKMFGVVTKPQASSYKKDQQFLFVNKRSVENKTISKAIKNAYSNLIEARAFPGYVLFLEIEPNLVDVNIHPRKNEVAFWNNETIYEFIFDAVKDVLAKEELIYKTDFYGNKLNKAAYEEFEILKDSVEKWNVGNESATNILQIANTYLLTNTKEGLLIIDQHAAHESILYEQYLEGFENKTKNMKGIKMKESLVINLTAKDSLLLEQNLEMFKQLGFEIESFGKNTFALATLPEIYKSHDIKKLIEELLEDLNEHKKLKTVDEKTKQTVAFLACRGAVKAGEYLNMEERKKLVEKLQNSKGYLACPHGRPTKVLISRKELDRLFKRV